jgi:hypothetical protein
MMPGPQFFQTAMGARFYEHTMPELVKQLKKLNDNLERMINQTAAKEQGCKCKEDKDGMSKV